MSEFFGVASGGEKGRNRKFFLLGTRFLLQFFAERQLLMGEKKWSLFWRRGGEEQLIEICGRLSGGRL
jgi:hypothetical protein